MKKFFPQSGYIAIVAAIIVSLIIMTAALALSFGSFISRENSSSGYYKGRSQTLAEACVETARLKIIGNSNYSGNETISVASDTCKIISVSPSGSNRIISAQGIFNNSYTDLQVTVTAASSSVVNWQELEHF